MISSKPLRPPRSRSRSATRSLFTAGTVALMLISGTSAALAQPSTTPAPTPSAAPDSGPSELAPTPVDPCATPTTTTPTSTTTAPPTTTTTAVPTPSCDTAPAAPESSTTIRAPSTTSSEPAPSAAPAALAPEAAAPSLAQAPLPAEPAADEPVAPTDEELSSKTAEPDPDWTPTENPKSTVTPGQMRSDREEIPAPFTKEDADNAETMEARQRMSRAAVGCQTYWPSPYEVCGVIRDKYNSLGGPGSFLSFPKTNELTNPGNTGKRSEFLNGPIYWSAATGAHPVVNSFLNRWGVHNYETGFLGYPTTDEIVHSDAIGRRQEFQNGAIYVAFQNAIGSAIANGAIRDKWNELGAHAGWLGYLTSDEFTVGVTRYHDFVNGRIYMTPWGGTEAVPSIRGLENPAASDDDCTRTAYVAGECVVNGGFEDVLDTLSDCYFGMGGGRFIPDDVIVLEIKHPTGKFPTVTLSCGNYRDHIAVRHDTYLDPENFLMCAAITHTVGDSYSRVADGYRGVRWTNGKTGTPGTEVYNPANNEIVTIYAGPDEDNGRDWGGCANGYIQDRPQP